MLNRDAFFAPRDLPRHELAIADLGGSVFVKTLTAGEFLALQERIDGEQAAGPKIKPIVDADALEKAKDALDGIRKDTLRVGLTEGQRKLMDLADDGATKEQIDEARQLLGVQERIEALSKVGNRNPFGDFSTNIDQLRDLAAQGKITADQLAAISGTAVSSLADAVKIDGDDALTEYAAVMEQLQKLYAAGKLTADQFATIRAQANTSLTDSLNAEAKRITDSVKSPLEQYQAEMERLNELLQRGLLSQGVFDKAALKARETLNNSAGEAKTDTQGIRADSQAAARFAYDSARGPARINTQMEYAKAQLKESKDQGRRWTRSPATPPAPPSPTPAPNRTLPASTPATCSNTSSTATASARRS